VRQKIHGGKTITAIFCGSNATSYINQSCDKALIYSGDGDQNDHITKVVLTETYNDP